MNKIRKTMMSVIKSVAVMMAAAAVVVGGSLSGYAAGMTDAGVTAGIEETDSANISAYVDEFRDRTRCESVSAVVVTPEGTAVYGDSDALYQIGSMTKAFTGLATWKLISEGALSESDTVSDLIPGFTAYYNSEPCEITVDQLLSQTSGYTNKESDYPSAAEGMTLQDWAMSISGRELSSKPGAEYAYSNVNYDLLGAIIEQVSGKTYAEYMSAEILGPLGLTHTYACYPGEGNSTIAAGEGSVSEDAPKIVSGSRLGYRHSYRYDIPVIEGRIPAGYFYSNTKDMAKWIEIWIGTADIPEEYRELVNAAKARLVDTGDYYSGWELFENGVVGHSGGTPNYSSRMVFSEKDKTGVCVLTNLNVAASTDGLCNGIYEIAVGSDAGYVPVDVWTVFDIIFSAISAVAVLSIIAAIFMKRRGAILALGIILLVLLVTICIVMPMVFGAGLGEIAFTWAPYSFAGGLGLMALGVLVSAGKFISIRKITDAG